VVLPPLRSRPREIGILARSFLEEACARFKRPALSLSVATMQRLAAWSWPGNVRELKNTMEYVAATVTGAIAEPSHLPDRIAGPSAPPPAATAETTPTPPPATREFRPIADEIRELERTRIAESLAASGGVQTRAAELIGMPLRTFVKRIKEYGLA
jgi:DNA-binding NtrC family response regulator